MPDQNQYLKLLITSLDEAQATDVVVIPVSKQTTITDYMIIASGRSSRHVKAIANQVMELMSNSGMTALRCNGLDTSEWVLIDFADFIVHIMQPECREFYNLEGLWQDRPSNLTQ
ncbi:MAG: ribosome silencing factor [Legionella sp.]